MNVTNPGPLRAKVVEVLGQPEEALFPKLSLQCASVHCEEVKGGKLTFDSEGFCEECSMGTRWQANKETREILGLMTSKSTGTLPVEHQEAIMFARENRAQIIRGATAEAARAAKLCSPAQLEIVARVGGMDSEQHLALMEARYDR